MTFSFTERRCEVGTVTSCACSTLANKAKYVLCSSSHKTMFLSDTMTSRIVQLVIIDIIYVCLFTLMGEGIMDQIYNFRRAVANNKDNSVMQHSLSTYGRV